MISPPAPVASSVALPWDAEVADPVAAIAAARASLGDTFVVESGEDRYLFLFSPAGLRSFYALDEAVASKGIADWRMLRRKLPPELFAGRRTLPHELFRRDDAAVLLGCVELVLDDALGRLAGGGGVVELFGWTRSLGHRFGLAAWAGVAPGDGRVDELCRALDALDGAEAFVRPADMAAVAASGMAGERAALARIEELLAPDAASRSLGLYPRLAAPWSGEVDLDGLARDVVLVHLGSMSNLFAALAWAVLDVAASPPVLERVRAGEPGLAERAALESVRLAQRSIMLRHVLAPVAVDDGEVVRIVDPGVTLATLLPLLNTSAASGLDRYDPDRWRGRRLADESTLAAREQVTAFGHGPHTCPAQPFSLAAMARTLERVFATFDAEVGATGRPGPLTGQIGGVARPDHPCDVTLRPR